MNPNLLIVHYLVNITTGITSFLGLIYLCSSIFFLLFKKSQTAKNALRKGVKLLIAAIFVWLVACLILRGYGIKLEKIDNELETNQLY